MANKTLKLKDCIFQAYVAGIADLVEVTANGHMMQGDLTTWWRKQLTFIYAVCLEAYIQALLLKLKLVRVLFLHAVTKFFHANSMLHIVT